MAACGVGVGFIPDFMLDALPRVQCLRPMHPNEPIPPRRVSLVQGNGRTLSTAAARLIHYLTETA